MLRFSAIDFERGIAENARAKRIRKITVAIDLFSRRESMITPGQLSSLLKIHSLRTARVSMAYIIIHDAQHFAIA